MQMKFKCEKEMPHSMHVSFTSKKLRILQTSSNHDQTLILTRE